MSGTSGEQVAGAVRRRWPRLIWVVLIASLAANLFVVGVVARSFWPGRYEHARGGPGGLLGNLMAYSRTLPADRRAAIRQEVGGERPLAGLRSLREEARAARNEAARLFKADPFDQTAFLAAEARVQAAETKMREAVVATASAIAARMTPQERAGFLQWRELRAPARGGRHADREPGSDKAGKKPAE